MKSFAKCLCSAAAGAIVTFLLIGPTWGPLKLMRTSHAQQTDSAAAKPSSGVTLGSANVKVDDGNADAVYANFAGHGNARGSDYRLCSESSAIRCWRATREGIRRLVLNFYTTKRLSIALQQTAREARVDLRPDQLDVRKRAANKDSQ